MLALTRRALAAFSFIAVLTAVSASAQAPAADDPRMVEARRRFDEAERIYERGDYAGALAEFQRIYQLLEGHPRRFFVLYNVGRCQEQLFQYADALDSYQRYLSEGGGAPDADAELAQSARQKIHDLNERLARLTVETNVDRAEVWVDGRQITTAPGLVIVTGGQHTIELRARGYAPGRQQVEIAARTEQTISIPLDRLGSGGISPAFFISGAALTVIAAGIGVGFGAAALSDHDRIQSWESSGDPRLRYQVTQEQIDAVAQNALLADVFFGAAALFGVASIVLLFVTDWGGSEQASPASATLRITPYAGATSAGLVAEGSF